MIGLLIGLLTVIMVLDCMIVIFLVLIQLPKKDAGAGLAFGAGATDALFGAGSGTVLTKITKYAAGAFFAMAILLSVLHSNYHRRAGREFEGALGRAGSAPPPLAQPGAASNAMVTGPTNRLVTPIIENPIVPATTSAPVILPSTNPPAAPSVPK